MGQARQKLTPETPYLLALLRTVVNNRSFANRDFTAWKQAK
jgi:hypothetical protein